MTLWEFWANQSDIAESTQAPFSMQEFEQSLMVAKKVFSPISLAKNNWIQTAIDHCGVVSSSVVARFLELSAKNVSDGQQRAIERAFARIAPHLNFANKVLSSDGVSHRNVSKLGFAMRSPKERVQILLQGLVNSLLSKLPREAQNEALKSFLCALQALALSDECMVYSFPDHQPHPHYANLLVAMADVGLIYLLMVPLEDRKERGFLVYSQLVDALLIGHSNTSSDNVPQIQEQIELDWSANALLPKYPRNEKDISDQTIDQERSVENSVYVVTETNFCLYVFLPILNNQSASSNALASLSPEGQITLFALNSFASPEVEADGLAVFRLTQECFVNALGTGAISGAEDVIRFLVSRSVSGSLQTIPDSVCDQLRMWETEFREGEI